jgi:hypothetical protein
VWSEGVKTGEMYGRLTAQHVDKYMRQRKVYGWVEILKGGRTCIRLFIVMRPLGGRGLLICVRVKDHINQRLREH